MIERIEELHLNENYSFFVTVQNNGTHFAGELFLTPNACTLIIRGDIYQERKPELSFGGIDDLVCRSFEGTFIMYGLKQTEARSRVLQHFPSAIGHFEYKYSVSHVVFVPGSFTSKVMVCAVELESPSIARWVGYTVAQDKIVQSHIEGTLFSFSSVAPDEFVQPLGDLGTLHVVYKPTTHYSSESFSMGLRFPPALLLTFNALKGGVEVVDTLRKIETLFSFLTGHPLDIKKIRLISEEGGRYGLSLYTPRTTYAESDRNYHFFPLGRNLRLASQLGLPEFPLDSFTEYFCLAPKDQRYFEKYLKYRKLQNPEERFLGYFRLLEKLCFQKDFFLDESKLINLIDRAKPYLVRYFEDEKNVKRLLKGLPRLNSSKLNTAGCILRFLETLPTKLRDSWIFGPSDIDAICKVRNDLTHANEFEPEEFEMERKAKFIEVLLVISLLRTIGVAIDVSAIVAPRISGHDLIRRPIEALFSSTQSG